MSTTIPAPQTDLICLFGEIATIVRTRRPEGLDTVIFLDQIETTDDLIRAFHAWLDGFDAVDDEQALLEQLKDCDRRLPDLIRVDLNLPTEATYGSAAELFRSLWFHVTEFDVWDAS